MPKGHIILQSSRENFSKNKLNKLFGFSQKYIPYVRHYNPRFVYFYHIFEVHFFVFLEVQERFLIKSGLWWREYGSYVICMSAFSNHEFRVFMNFLSNQCQKSVSVLFVCCLGFRNRSVSEINLIGYKISVNLELEILENMWWAVNLPM